ncbi:mucin-5AC-like isoform X2 [Mastomys coucha]|uniref:mucin-5AC-like isoform X2 n=1 Tax=Mastomys coucha TaxID=35658 RepID=UPI0012624E40|nr:mucin-5AC-like isoform X2 [Mastomys coucha]
MNEYKNIVLQKGLERVDNYQFRKIKSLLRKELKLTKQMQDDFDRINLADWMEDKFPKEAGLDKLIKACELIEELEDLTKELKTEKAKVQKKKKGKCKTTLKNKKQDELSMSESLICNESNKNKPSSKKKRKQTTKTEGGKRKKLTKEQAQLPETSGTNIQRDEDWVQTPHKPPPTPPSNSSNKKQKNTTIQRHSIMKTKGPQGKQQLVESSSTSSFPAVSELLTFEELSATASSSPQSPQKPQEAHMDLKMSPGSPTSPFQKFRVPRASDSCIHPNANVPSTLLSDAKILHVPSAAAFSNVRAPLKPSEMVVHSSSAPQTSLVTMPRSTQDLHFPTPAAFNSPEALHSQAIASRNVQTTRVPSATLTRKAQLRKMPPPSTATSNAQDPHTLATMSRSTSVSQVPQTTTSRSIPTLSSATVKASKEVQGPQISLSTVPKYFQASLAPPTATLSSLTAPQVPMSISTSRAQTTQIHPGTGSICVQTLHAPPSTESRSVCTTPLMQGEASGTGKALPLPKGKASRKVQAPRMSSTTPSSSLLDPHATSSTISSSFLPSHTTLSTASSHLLDPHATSTITSSSLLPSHTALPTASSSLLPSQITSTIKSSSLLPSQTTSSITSSSLLDPHATSSTASSSLLASHGTLPTASSSLLVLQLSPATASRAPSATPGPSATINSSPSRTPRRGIVPKEPAREEGHQQGPKQVMVLKVTEPFTYDMREDKRMFHATVATETEFFRVKVFDTTLISKFIPRKIIFISDYFGCNGFLEIYSASCVSDVNVNPTMVVSNTLRQRANATPKISHLFSQAKGTFVNGEFVVVKKTERNELIYYGIEDDTGKMEVVVYGRLTNIKCEPGNKLRLVCFELTSTEDGWQLKSVRHSYMKVIIARK